MRTIANTFRPLLSTVAVVASMFALSACGSSPDPRQARDSLLDAGADGGNDSATPTDAASDAAPSGPIRTMREGSLIPTAPENLVPNPMFSPATQSWGDFIVTVGIDTGTLRAHTRFDAPMGSASVGTPIDSSGAGRAMTLVSNFVGGPGPFAASFWVSASDKSDAYVAFDPATVKITVGTGAAGTEKAFDLTANPAESITIAGRTWIHYAATVTSDLGEGATLLVHLPKLTGSWLLVAPEVVAEKSLAAAIAKSKRPPSLARSFQPEERAARDRLRSSPPRLPGLPSPRDFVRGKDAPPRL